MASFQPFLPAVKSGAAGLTQNTGALASNSQVVLMIDSTGTENTTLLVNAIGPAGTTAFIRLSVESSTAITASLTDTPLPGNPNGYVRLFANPNPSGKTAVAVIVSTSGATSSIIWVTPGQGGDV